MRINETAQKHAEEAVKWTMVATGGRAEEAIAPSMAIQIAQVEATLAVYTKLCDLGMSMANLAQIGR